MRYIENFYKYRYLLNELVLRDIKLKYRKSYLGILWSMLNPLLMMLVLTVIFSSIFSSNIENFPVYLMSGQLIFNFFSESTNQAMTAIIGNSGLIKKVYIPKYIFPISRVLSSFVNLLFSIVALLLIMIITKVQFNPAMFLFLIPLIYVLVLSIGIGLILSAYSVFFRDIVHLYGVFTMALMYMTPIFYPFSIVPDAAKPFLMLNPLFHIISCFRSILLDGNLGLLENHLVSIAYCVLFLIVGVVTFIKKQDRFILYI